MWFLRVTAVDVSSGVYLNVEVDSWELTATVTMVTMGDDL